HLLPPPSPLFPYTTLFRSAAGLPRHIGEIPDALGPHHRIPFPVQDDHVRARTVAVGLLVGADWKLGDVRAEGVVRELEHHVQEGDRKSTRLNSSHVKISYA